MLLDSLRQKKSSLVIYFIFGMIILSFILWGGFGRQGETEKVLIKIGDIEVTESEFAIKFDSQRQRLGNVQLDERFLNYLRRLTVSALVREKVFYRAAQAYQIPYTDEEVSKYIIDAGYFVDPKTGKFDRESYIDYIDQNRMTVRQFEGSIRIELLNAKLNSIMKMPIQVNIDEAFSFYNMENTKIELEFLEINPRKDLLNLRVSEERMRDYYNAHQNELKTDEKRSIRVLKIFPEDLKAQVQLQMEDIQDYYNRNILEVDKERKKSYSEKRAWAKHILIETKKTKEAKSRAGARRKARKILKRVKQDPTQFELIAREMSDDPSAVQNGGDLGYFAYSAMVKPFSEAVFKAKAGEIIGPVETPFGLHVIQVMDVHNDEGLGMKRFRSEIESKIREERAAELQTSILQDLEKLLKMKRSGDQTSLELFNLISEKYGLPVVEIEPFLKTGVVQTLPDSFILVEEAFRLGMDTRLSDLIRQNRRAYIIYLSEIVAPEPLPFEDAKERIKKRLRKDIVLDRLSRILQTAKSTRQTPTQLASRYKLKRESTGLFPQFGQERLPKIGSSAEIGAAIARIRKAREYLPKIYRVNAKLYMIYVKKLETPDSKKFYDDPLKHLDRLRQEGELQVSVKLSSLFQQHANIPEDYVQKLKL